MCINVSIRRFARACIQAFASTCACKPRIAREKSSDGNGSARAHLTLTLKLTSQIKPGPPISATSNMIHLIIHLIQCGDCSDSNPLKISVTCCRNASTSAQWIFICHLLNIWSLSILPLPLPFHDGPLLGVAVDAYPQRFPYHPREPCYDQFLASQLHLHARSLHKKCYQKKTCL